MRQGSRTNHDDERVLYEWHKTDTEIIRASVKAYKGKPYYSLRLYYRDQSGEFRPTKKGLTLAADHMPDLVKAVKALEEAAKGERANARR